jgi:hypothetical protein
METEIQEIYKECIEKKVQIELCYKVLRENYIKYRIDLFVNLQTQINEFKKQFFFYNANNIKNEKMINSYRDLLLKYTLFKKRIEILLKFSKPILDESTLTKMVDDQNTLMEMISKINKTLPENQINEIYEYIKAKM